MKMHPHRSSRRAVAPLLVVLVVLAGLAPTIQHRSDNFNNNALAAFWEAGATGNINVVEMNQRLQFERTGNTGAQSAAGVLFKSFGINWKKNFHIEWTYRFKLNNVTPGRQLLMGTALALTGDFPNTMTGFFCGLLRDGPLLHVLIAQYSNGVIVNFDTQTITQATGKIEIDWNKAADTMTVARSGGPPATLSGLFANLGGVHGNSPMAITQNAVSLNGNVSFAGKNVYIDNWEADFVKRKFP